MRNFTSNERFLIIFKRREEGLTIGDISEEFHMSRSNLCRIENGKIMVSKENEKLLEERFSIDFFLGEKPLADYELLSNNIIEWLIFYKLFDTYSEEKIKYTNSKVLKSVAYPYYILTQLLVYSVKNIEWKFVEKYIKIFEKLSMFLDDKYSKIYYISKINFHYFNKEYNKAITLTKFVEKEFHKNDLLDSYILHIKAIIYGCMGEKEITLKTLDQAIFLSIKTNNWVRLIALNITKANCLRLSGDYTLALKEDKKTINYSLDHEVHIYDYILNRNIAWTHYLLNDYENALIFYTVAEKFDMDNDLCFMKALCYYRLDFRKECEFYLMKGRRTKSSGIAFPYLLDWLELMLNKKYSLKSLQKLLYCLKKFKDTMHVDSQKNIYLLLIDYYSYHKDEKMVFYYKQKLALLLTGNI